jgi:hypothetical protein
MALDHDNLFTVLGKYVKTINTFEGYKAVTDAALAEIFVILETYNVEKHYDPLVGQFDSFKDGVSSMTRTLIGDCTTVLTDRDFVLTELPISEYDITSVLEGLHAYMVTNSEDIQTSVVTLGGADADLAASGVATTEPATPILFVGRKLDGVNDPGNGVNGRLEYDNFESQLSKDDTIYAKIESNDLGRETALLYGTLPGESSYGRETELPGVGPTLTSPEGSNLVRENHNFKEWSGVNTPVNWGMTGVIATDYADNSGVGTGPLLIKTPTITAQQQVTLQYNRTYFMACSVSTNNYDSLTDTVGIRLKTQSGTAIVAQVTATMGSATGVCFPYTFFSLDDTVDLNNLYVEVEFVSEGHADNQIKIEKVVLSSAVYYNGLAWTWWPPFHTSANNSQVTLGDRNSIAIVNNDVGVFQTFFRKAYNIQLPTADSPQISDTLATA